MSIKLIFFLFALCALAVTSGCATETVATLSIIHPDGSYDRTVTYKTNGSNQDSKHVRSKAESQEARKHNRADDFVLPKSAEWKSARSNDEGSDVLVATRAVRSGVTLFDDMGLKQDDPTGNKHFAKPLVGNRVAVTRTADGHIKYQEILHWNGGPFSAVTEADSAIAACLKPYLPASARQNHAEVSALALDIQKRVWQSLFSPPHPLLPELLASPDYGTYAIARQIRPQIGAALTSHCGSAVAVTAAAPLAERLAKYCLSRLGNAKQGTNQSPVSGGSIDALFYRVRFPGKVTSSNGEVDPEANEVIWSLYTVAACPRDITLSATCEAEQSD